MENRQALWRDLLLQKYFYKGCLLLPGPSQLSKFSSLWYNITSPPFGSHKFSNVLVFGITVSLGDGSRISCWKDTWAADFSLAEAFSRVFALSVNKVGRVIVRVLECRPVVMEYQFKNAPL